MGIVMDIVLAAFVILNIIMGYKKGLIGVIFNICAFLISIVITLILFKPASTYIINNTEIDDNIKNMILRNNVENAEMEEEENLDIQKYIESNIKDIENKTKSQVMEIVANNVSEKSVEVLTGIIIFIAVRIVVNLLKFLLESLAEIPLIKQFNQVGGVAYGAVKSIVIIYLVLTILFFVVSINNNGIIANMIDSSYVTKILYNNNIIVKYCLLDKNLL